jgi:hypothetical protein
MKDLILWATGSVLALVSTIGLCEAYRRGELSGIERGHQAAAQEGLGAYRLDPKTGTVKFEFLKVPRPYEEHVLHHYDYRSGFVVHGFSEKYVLTAEQFRKKYYLLPRNRVSRDNPESP